MKNTTAKTPLWLIEYYTNNGFIRFAWVGADTHTAALSKMESHKKGFAGFNEKITINEASKIISLGKTTYKPLVIDVEEYHLAGS